MADTLGKDESQQQPEAAERAATAFGKPKGGAQGIGSGLNPGGTAPGGGPDAGLGSLGTGGGSSGGASTGAPKRGGR